MGFEDGKGDVISYETAIDQKRPEMSARAKLSSKFQISIPKEVRTAQDWHAGQEFVFIPKGAGVLVMPAPNLEDLRGLAKGARRGDYRDRRDRA